MPSAKRSLEVSSEIAAPLRAKGGAPDFTVLPSITMLVGCTTYVSVLTVIVATGGPVNIWVRSTKSHLQSRLIQIAPEQISGSAIVLMVKIEEHGIRRVWRTYSGLLSPPNWVVNSDIVEEN